MLDKKNISVRVSHELFYKLKLHVFEEDTTLNSCIISLIEQDLENQKQDKK